MRCSTVHCVHCVQCVQCVQCTAAHWGVMQCSTVQCSTLECDAGQFSKVKPVEGAVCLSSRGTASQRHLFSISNLHYVDLYTIVFESLYLYFMDLRLYICISMLMNIFVPKEQATFFSTKKPPLSQMHQTVIDRLDWFWPLQLKVTQCGDADAVIWFQCKAVLIVCHLRLPKIKRNTFYSFGFSTKLYWLWNCQLCALFDIAFCKGGWWNVVNILRGRTASSLT